MELPLLGEVSVPDIIFAALLLAMLVRGFVRGLGREARALAAALPAACLSLYPAVHAQVTAWLSFLPEPEARATAYVAVYYGVAVILRVIMEQFKTLRELKTSGPVSAILGGGASFLRCGMDLTMFIILASGWRLPWEALYKSSKIADFIVELWHQFGLLNELYAAFTLLKF